MNFFNKCIFFLSVRNPFFSPLIINIIPEYSLREMTNSFWFRNFETEKSLTNMKHNLPHNKYHYLHTKIYCNDHFYLLKWALLTKGGRIDPLLARGWKLQPFLVCALGTLFGNDIKTLDQSQGSFHVLLLFANTCFYQHRWLAMKTTSTFVVSWFICIISTCKRWQMCTMIKDHFDDTIELEMWL